jgi:hypothetical protein
LLERKKGTCLFDPIELKGIVRGIVREQQLRANKPINIYLFKNHTVREFDFFHVIEN